MPTRVVLTAALLASSLALAQPTWQPAPTSEPARVELFPSIVTASFPTTETLARGDFHYEISHRFHPPVKDGYDANFGLDGPVTMRTALSYGLSDRLLLTLGRSNLLDNLDLQLKYRWLQFEGARFPAAVALCGGAAWNSDVAQVRDRLAAANFQYLAQVVLNARVLDGRLGIGLVPSYVHNSTVFSVRRQHTLTLGTYCQYRIGPSWAVLLEYNPAVSGYQGSIEYGTVQRSHDSLSLGTSLDTGGHTFFVFVTNNTRLNPTQYLVGAPADAHPDHWRLAFGLTRYL